MSIEFGCCECGKLLRVPESSAGMKARCPACGAIQHVASPPEVPRSQSILEPVIRPEYQTTSTEVAPPADSPFAAPGSSRNPFADGVSTESSNPFAPGMTNPYAAPASGVGMVGQGMFGAGGQAWARTSVEGPAKWLAAVGGVVIVFTVIGLAINVSRFIRDGVLEDAIFVVIGTLVMVIPYGIVIFGATRMKQLKNYPLAITASILAMLPCSACCIIGLPVGIWSLIVLCNRDIRSAFQQAA